MTNFVNLFKKRESNAFTESLTGFQIAVFSTTGSVGKSALEVSCVLVGHIERKIGRELSVRERDDVLAATQDAHDSLVRMGLAEHVGEHWCRCYTSLAAIPATKTGGSKRFVCTRWSDGHPRMIRWSTRLALIFANEGELRICYRSRPFYPRTASLEELREYAREFDQAVDEAQSLVESTRKLDAS